VETTATTLTFTTYALAKHPELFDELAKELSNYTDIDSLKSAELEQLPLLNALIRESIRLWPPGPGPIPRVLPPQGAMLGGYYIPGGVYRRLNIHLQLD